MSTEVVIPFFPREHQARILREMARFNVLVCHRRFGKTVLAINLLVREAATSPLLNPRCAYLAPLYRQAKAVAWDYLRRFAGPVPGVRFFENELRADFPNGGRVQLFGSDNPDALRGIYLDGVVLDEPAQMRGRLWGEVVRPALADREGWAVFIGTPQGHNSFYQLHQQAATLPGWYSATFRASETGILPEDELAAARLTMTEEAYDQEFECSFEAAVRGAFYGKELAEAEASGRVCDVPIDPALPVNTAWDLGMADSTVIWFFQVSPGGQIRLVDYYETEGEALRHYADVLEAREYRYGVHLAPHDIAVRELGTGKSRLEVARGLGLNFEIAPNLPLLDGINAAKMALPVCWFDRGRTARGLEALKLYRAAQDSLGLLLSRPLHDWTSHAADAFRMLAVGRDSATMVVGAGKTEAAYQADYDRYAPPV